MKKIISLLFACFVFLSGTSYAQDMSLDEVEVYMPQEWYDSISPDELVAHDKIHDEMIDYCYDYTGIQFDGKYQSIIRLLKDNDDYYSKYEKFLFIVDTGCEWCIEDARKGYELNHIGKPNRVKYWIKINEDQTMDFEYRHTKN